MKEEQCYLYAPPDYWDLTQEQLDKLLDNGECGSGWIGELVVPDGFFGISMTKCCEIHDYMYHTGKPSIKGKEEADRVFLNNMTRTIYWTTASYEDEEEKKRTRHDALIQAKLYYKGVHWFGGPAYWSNKNKPETYRAV